MEFPNPKIKFYKVRTFSEKLNVSFAFFRETWKTFLKYSLYITLPICLVQAYAMNAYLHNTLHLSSIENGSYSDAIITLIADYGLLMLCVLIGQCVLSALIFSLIQAYETRETRLLDIRFSDFKTSFVANLKKMLRLTLFGFAVILAITLIVGLLAWLALWSLAITLPLLLIAAILVMIPFMLLPAVYLLGRHTFSVALKKTFRYGFATWGETFLVVLVFGLLANIISGVTTMPWYIVTIIGEILSLGNPDSAFNMSVWYQFGAYLLAVIQAFGAYLSVILTTTGMAFHYFSVVEKKDNVLFDENIRNFEQL